MNTPEWIKYDGSDGQNREILGSKMDVLCRYANGVHRLKSTMFTGDWRHKTLTNYLICQPHPYADLIKIWADTGCPVYAKHRETGQKCVLQGPRIDWNYEEWEFSLTSFED